MIVLDMDLQRAILEGMKLPVDSAYSVRLDFTPGEPIKVVVEYLADLDAIRPLLLAAAERKRG